MQILRSALALLIILLLTSCDAEIPAIKQGSVIFKNVESSVQRDLTKQQILDLSKWLSKHRSIWMGCYFTPPPSPVVSVQLMHEDGTTSSFSQRPIKDAKALLVAGRLSGQNDNQPCSVATISAAEVLELHQALGLPE